jgi:Growth inhibitor
MVKAYAPERGDLVWLDFTPQAGHEQAGRRPAIVISPRVYNEKAGLALFCPITSQEKGYPFEVKIAHKKIAGVALSDQIKSLDWEKRKIEFIAKASKSEIDEAIEKIKALVG